MKVLLAEDDDITRHNLTDILQDEGYHVVSACDGDEAVQQWSQSSVDLVLLDIMMPGLSGYDVCREIRKTNTDVPIMFVSAKSEEVDVVVGLELGADDFLRKPFGKHELLARVRALLRRQDSSKTSDSFKFGDWTVWRTLLRASKNNEQLDLTPREVGILQQLQSQGPNAVTRDQMLNECWGVDYFPESRTLDQHISNLRKKIGADGILTVRGEGYKYGYTD